MTCHEKHIIAASLVAQDGMHLAKSSDPRTHQLARRSGLDFRVSADPTAVVLQSLRASPGGRQRSIPGSSRCRGTLATLSARLKRLPAASRWEFLRSNLSQPERLLLERWMLRRKAIGLQAVANHRAPLVPDSRTAPAGAAKNLPAFGKCGQGGQPAVTAGLRASCWAQFPSCPSVPLPPGMNDPGLQTLACAVGGVAPGNHAPRDAGWGDFALGATPLSPSRRTRTAQPRIASPSKVNRFLDTTGKAWFSASVTIRGLRIQASHTPDEDVAARFLAAFAVIKRAMLSTAAADREEPCYSGVGQGFSRRLRTVLRAAIEANGLVEHVQCGGLTYIVRVWAKVWTGGVLTTPRFRKLDDAILAWNVLRGASDKTRQGHRTDQLGVEDAEATWASLRSRFVEVCSLAGRSRGAVERRLTALRSAATAATCQKGRKRVRTADIEGGNANRKRRQGDDVGKARRGGRLHGPCNMEAKGDLPKRVRAKQLVRGAEMHAGLAALLRRWRSGLQRPGDACPNRVSK